jgi:hypothetical protein
MSECICVFHFSPHVQWLAGAVVFFRVLPDTAHDANANAIAIAFDHDDDDDDDDCFVACICRL